MAGVHDRIRLTSTFNDNNSQMNCSQKFLRVKNPIHLYIPNSGKLYNFSGSYFDFVGLFGELNELVYLKLKLSSVNFLHKVGIPLTVSE